MRERSVLDIATTDKQLGAFHRQKVLAVELCGELKGFPAASELIAQWNPVPELVCQL